MSSFCARLLLRLFYTPVGRRVVTRTTVRRQLCATGFLLGALALPWQNREEQIQQRAELYAERIAHLFSVRGFNNKQTTLKKSVLAIGDGKTAPKQGEYVQINYTCWFLDGTEFDSSRPDGEYPRPFEFQLGSDLVVDGMEQALKTMTVGERSWFLLPPHIGFGDKDMQAHGRTVPANSYLVFDIMLLGVTKKPKYDFDDEFEEKPEAN